MIETPVSGLQASPASGPVETQLLIDEMIVYNYGNLSGSDAQLLYGLSENSRFLGTLRVLYEEERLQISMTRDN